MKVQLIGKTDGVFKVEIETDTPDMFSLSSVDGDKIRANTCYIDEIVDMLLKAKTILNPEKI